jgi:pyruvate formate lyase activating enzyme
MDSSVHRTLTGLGNELILENIKRIAMDFVHINIIVRTPVIPGYNDSEDNIKTTAEFVSRLPGLHQYELLPYHTFGVAKYAQLGRPYQLAGLNRPSVRKMDSLNNIVKKNMIRKTCTN